jgi:VIT1/CCC1 family predicted Fe2+/Mn2+ transporter
MLKTALTVQRRETTEYFIYVNLAEICRDPHNAAILRSIGEEEKRHAEFWKGKTGVETKPCDFRVFQTVLMARILGLTFTLKQMEKNEGISSSAYIKLTAEFPEAKRISEEEAIHENQLLSMLDEERLRYMGSIVLGLNDALVELTGALAGFTLALGETKLISLAGLVTGISASFSMGASEYLSCRADNDPKALKSALYTGTAYFITVMILILPFLLGMNKFTAMGSTLSLVVLVILFFNYYLSVARDLDFKRRFGGMVFISLGVAALSFAAGWVLKNVLGVDA